MESLLQDIRYGARVLYKKAGFTAVAVLTLAIGIGATTAIFSVVNGVLFRPLPYEEPDDLVMVWQDFTRRDGPRDEWVSADDFFDWRDSAELFSGLFILDGFGATLTGLDEPEMLNGAAASYNAFDVIGIQPILGRGFRPEEDLPNASEFVVVLGYSFWQRRFGGEESVIGSTLTLDGNPATIVGIMPPDFAFPAIRGNDIFAPLRIDRTNSCGRGCVTLHAVARLDEGVTLDEAQAEMTAIAARLEQEYPRSNSGVGVWLQPLHETVVGQFRTALLVLLGAVGFVLLIACANVANLMLARATGREREVAIRMAMGAGSGRMFRQMITESLMLALAGAGFGVIIALWGVDLLIALVPAGVPRFHEVGVDIAALGFTLLLAMGTGLIFGLVPALRISQTALNESLKDGGRGTGVGVGGQRFRAGLVVAEVALALTLLVGGGLLIRSFVTLMSVDPGFDADNVLTQQIFLPAARYTDNAQMISFVDQLVERVDALPGVDGAGVIYVLPMAGGNADTGFLIEGMQPAGPGERNPVAWYRPVSPGYFDAMKMRLVAGRWFTESDHAVAPPVVLINETAARRYWPDREPIGTRITVGGGIYREVVGVVADTKHFGLDSDTRPAMYFPYDQLPQPFMSLVLRTSGDPHLLARSVQSEIRELDPDLAVSGVASMREVISDTVAVAQSRLIMALLATFAASAMTLAAIGLYGVMSYSVGQRTQEIGIRMALGARTSDVLNLVVGRGMLLLLVGVAIGVAAAFALSRFLESMLFEVSSTDPLTFAAVPVLLALVALFACWVPARRAAKVDPLVALRRE